MALVQRRLVTKRVWHHLVIRLQSNKTNEGGTWIPPDRPPVGDKGQSHLYSHVEEAEELKRLEKELERLERKEKMPEAEDGVDWLKTRRAMLSGTQLLKPDEAASARRDLSDIPIKKHRLLTMQEISTCMEALGGVDIKFVADAYNRMGVKGIILVTAEQYTQRRMLAETLTRQLRRRSLHEVGVVGAEFGVDGRLDDPNETWLVVDCHNYVVHIQDSASRRHVDLEKIWSGKDGLHRVDGNDDDAVEDYVAANPVPADYGDSVTSDWDETLKRLEKSRWIAPSRTPLPPKSKGKGFRRRPRR